MIRTRYWVIAVVLILAVCGVTVALIYAGSGQGKTARIILDGEVVRTVELSGVDEPYEFDVTSEHGTNRIRVEQGRICVVGADCPDRLCVGMGWRSKGAAPIACLPHRLVIKVEDDAGIDAVAGVNAVAGIDAVTGVGAAAVGDAATGNDAVTEVEP